jgi:phosphoglucomutase
VLGRQADDAYLSVASRAVVDPCILKQTKLKVAFTNIHGTGGLASVPLLLHAKCEVNEVLSQIAFDPRFPTVKSPNPENAEALSLAVKVAEERGCDLVVGTDPDADRMGVAVRNRAGKLEFLTGNQIGAMFADYRLTRYKELGWIPKAGSERVCLIKTFVTSALQDAIGRTHGVKVINTLTGFKWIAAKLRGYEQKLVAAMGPEFRYEEIPFRERALLMQEHSTFYVFGGEESYGYLPNDFVRDKDGNAACLMTAEVCAWVRSRGLTVPEYLNEIYLRCGFYLEGVINIYYEGASGNAKIARILSSYRENPPTAFGGTRVVKFEDFGRQDIRDADGELIPKQDLYFVTLDNGYTFAARGSGTEPKMKFYLFGNARVATAAELPGIKDSVRTELDRLKQAVEADARSRAEG